VLTVQASRPSIALRDGAPELVITLTLTLAADAAPLALLPDDLSVTAGGTALDLRWEPPLLTPGVPTTVALRLPAWDGAAIELALAGWRARISGSR